MDGMQRHGPPWQDSHAGVFVGDERDARDPETFDQRLIRAEEEGPVAPERTPQRESELVALEIGDRLVGGIEEVLGVELRVAHELEGGTVDGIVTLSGSRH